MDGRALKDKAGQLFTKGRFAKAAEAYEEYFSLDKNDHHARLRCGDAWAKAGKKDKAIAAYSAAADGFARDGFLPRAIAASKLVLEIDPSHTGVQKMLAGLYAQKSGGARGSSGSGIRAAPKEMEISRSVEAPTTSNFSSRTDAIELDAPVAPQKPRRAAAADVVPSPMNRADALELPEYEIPMEDGASSVGGMSAQRGPTPADRSDAIEIELEPEAVHGPPPLTATAIDIEFSPGEGSGGEIEIPIEGQPLPFLDQLPAELQTAAPLAPAVTFDLAAPVYELTVEVDPPAQPPPAPASGVYDLTDAVPESRPSAPPFELTEVAEAPAPAAPPPPADGAPPGLKPRRVEGASSVAPTASRIWLPPTFVPAAGPSGTVQTAPLAVVAPPPATPTTAAEPSTDLERSLRAFMQFELPAEPSRAPPQAPAAKDFTELDLETDSLLHAVEAAAAKGSGAAGAPVEERMDAPDDGRAEPGGLPRIALFSDLPEDAFIALFEKCPLQRFEPGQLIFEQGEKADAFYVICGGQVRVFRTEGEKRHELATLEEGSFFGEMALLSEAPRSASVEAAAEDTQVLVIAAEILTELSGAHPVVATALKKFCRQRMLTNLMNQAPLFAPFNRNDRRDLVQKFRARDVNRGDVLVNEGQPSDGLYVVLSGEVEVVAKNQRIATLKEGQLFGEMSLLQRSPASATVRALRHTSLLRLPKPDFDSLILSHPQVLEYVAELVDARKKPAS